MALVGQGFAIMSVGISCQAAFQIRERAGLIAAAAGEPLALQATPWDWTICGPAGVAAMLDDGVTFPRDVGELEQRHRPYWPARSCWFWHLKGAVSDHAGGVARAQKVEASLDLVAGARRRAFVLANTQNNLHGWARDHGGFSVPLRLDDVEALRAALVRRFGAVELYVVTYAGGHSLGGRPGVVKFTPDRAEWQGDKRQWGELLVGIARGTVAPFA